MNTKDIIKIIFGSALITTLLSSIAKFIAFTVYELYGQPAKQMLYNMLTSVSLVTIFQVLIINLGAAGVAYMYKTWIYSDLPSKTQAIMKIAHKVAIACLLLYDITLIVFLIVNMKRGPVVGIIVIVIVVIIIFTMSAINDITTKQRKNSIKLFSKLGYRVVFLVAITILYIYVAFLWLMSNMAIKQILDRIKPI